jgi:hypothetical protein
MLYVLAYIKYFNARCRWYTVLADEVYACYFAIYIVITFRILALLLLNGLADDDSCNQNVQEVTL